MRNGQDKPPLRLGRMRQIIRRDSGRLSRMKINPSGRLLCLCATAVLCSRSILGYAQTTVPDLDKVQRFGPMVIISAHEPVPDPEKTARILLDEQGTARLKALEILGIQADPVAQSLWQDLLHTHQDVSPEAFLNDSFSTAVPSLFFGEGATPQKLVDAGFDTLSEEPFWIDAVFSQEAGQWFRIATIACRCKLMEVIEPAKSLTNRKSSRPQELVYRIDMSPENDYEWHLQEVRFRLRDGLLKPVIQYEAESWKCPDGYQSGHLCTGIFGNLASSILVDNSGKNHAGAALFSGTQTSHMQDKELARIQTGACTPYVWNDVAFQYEVSPWSAKACKGHASWTRKP
jgi:hypothetical protein